MSESPVAGRIESFIRTDGIELKIRGRKKLFGPKKIKATLGADKGLNRFNEEYIN